MCGKCRTLPPPYCLTTSSLCWSFPSPYKYAAKQHLFLVFGYIIFGQIFSGLVKRKIAEWGLGSNLRSFRRSFRTSFRTKMGVQWVCSMAVFARLKELHKAQELRCYGKPKCRSRPSFLHSKASHLRGSPLLCFIPSPFASLLSLQLA